MTFLFCNCKMKLNPHWNMKKSGFVGYDHRVFGPRINHLFPLRQGLFYVDRWMSLCSLTTNNTRPNTHLTLDDLLLYRGRLDPSALWLKQLLQRLTNPESYEVEQKLISCPKNFLTADLHFSVDMLLTTGDRAILGLTENMICGLMMVRNSRAFGESL